MHSLYWRINRSQNASNSSFVVATFIMLDNKGRDLLQGECDNLIHFCNKNTNFLSNTLNVTTKKKKNVFLWVWLIVLGLELEFAKRLTHYKTTFYNQPLKVVPDTDKGLSHGRNDYTN
jgi:hypothetical protein